jgi:hypothetical protein
MDAAGRGDLYKKIISRFRHLLCQEYYSEKHEALICIKIRASLLKLRHFLKAGQGSE